MSVAQMVYNSLVMLYQKIIFLKLGQISSTKKSM